MGRTMQCKMAWLVDCVGMYVVYLLVMLEVVCAYVTAVFQLVESSAFLIAQNSLYIVAGELCDDGNDSPNIF